MTEFAVYAAIVLIMSAVLFFTMGKDKRLAVHHARRIPEAELFLFALLGGAIGGWAGMKHFHHKTLHAQFRLGFPLLAVIQLLAGAYLLIRA